MNIKKIIVKYKNSSPAFKASIWYMICNILIKGFALLSTPVFTHLLTGEEYGTFSIFQSWYSILIIFTSLNIFLGGYAKGLLLYKGKENEYTSASLMQTTLITLIFIGIYFLNIPLWTKFFDIAPHLMVGLFLELLFMPALDFWAARKRFEYKYKSYVFVTILMSLSGLFGAIISVILLKYKLEARIYSDVISKCIFSMVLFFLLLYKGKCIFNKKYWLYNFKFNIPLIPHYLSNYALSQSDRLMIGKLIGKAQAGIYSVAYTVSMMMNLIVSAINNSLTPYIYKSIENKKFKDIKTNTAPLFVLVATLSIFVMFFAPEVIYIFGGKNYIDAIYVIPPISASVYFIFTYAMFSTVEYYYQKTVGIAIATTASAILNLILNYIFIPIFGYFAAGYTTLICYIFLTLFHYYFYKIILRKETKDIKSLYNEKLIFFVSICLVIVMILITFIYKYTYLRYLFIILMFIIIVIKRNTFFKILSKIRN